VRILVPSSSSIIKDDVFLFFLLFFLMKQVTSRVDGVRFSIKILCLNCILLKTQALYLSIYWS